MMGTTYAKSQIQGILETHCTQAAEIESLWNSKTQVLVKLAEIPESVQSLQEHMVTINADLERIIIQLWTQQLDFEV